MSDGLLLWSYDLVSKWGFNDGDMPEELMDLLDDAGLKYGDLEWHPILRRLVREYLLPQIPQRVEVYDIETIHNPIRASTVDGREVDDRAERVKAARAAGLTWTATAAQVGVSVSTAKRLDKEVAA